MRFQKGYDVLTSEKEGRMPLLLRELWSLCSKIYLSTRMAIENMVEAVYKPYFGNSFETSLPD